MRDVVSFGQGGSKAGMYVRRTGLRVEEVLFMEIFWWVYIQEKRGGGEREREQAALLILFELQIF